MSTLIWPPTPASSDAHSHASLLHEAESTTARELEWLLVALQDTLQSLKEGLSSCADLLAPQPSGVTLAVSSHRSESLKGVITRVGARVVKGDLYLRLASLPLPRGQNSYKVSLSTAPTAPDIVLSQLTTTRTLINGCLDVVDATRWTGDAQNANFISGQLRLLHEHIQEAHAALKGDAQVPWNEAAPLDEKTFAPPLPSNLHVHLGIADAALVLTVRVLEPASSSSLFHESRSLPVTTAPTPRPTTPRPTTPVPPGSSAGLSSTPPPPATSSGGLASFTGFSLRERFASALGVARPATHDEAHEVFLLRTGDKESQVREVRVREKVRVESQDPCLMAALAKLAALEKSVLRARRALAVVMGVEEEDF